MPSPNRVLVGAPGSGVAPITTSEAITYNVNTEKITPDIASDHNKDQYGNPNQAMHQKGLQKYAGNWQLASGATLPPSFGSYFTRALENEGTLTFLVLTAEIDKTSDTKIRTVDVTGEVATGGSGAITTSSS